MRQPEVSFFNSVSFRVLKPMEYQTYGVSKNLLSIANHTTHIEMFGKNSSMNLAQATAICLYEVTNNYQL